MRCHYEVLQIEQSADASEIKVAYRKQALVWHPDKNMDRLEEAETRFKEIQAAYTVLSDPNERAWYDNHRDAILLGKDATEGEEVNAINLWGFFSDSCYSGFDNDTENNFYKVYADLFEEIDRQEIAESGEDSRPYFGTGSTTFDSVDSFYAVWNAFSSKKSFAWCDKYQLSQAPTRQIKRLMEKDNKKARDKARKTFNQTVRQLVSFVKKRDPRWAEYVEQEEEKRRIKQEQVKERQRKEKGKKKAKMEKYQADYEKQLRELNLDELAGEEIKEDVDKEELYCLVCKKAFRSKNQWLNHEKSKKHLEMVEKVRETLMFDDEILDPLMDNTIPEEENEEELDDDDEDEINEEEIDEELDADAIDDNLDDEDIVLSDELLSEGELEELMDKDVYKELLQEEEEDEEEEEVIQLSSFRNKKNRKKKKKQNKARKFEFLDEPDIQIPSEVDKEIEVKKEEDTPETEIESKNEVDTPPKLTAKQKRKARRAKKEKNNSENVQVDTSLQCATCGVSFPSRNKLFAHVKKTRHAKPL